MSDDRQATSIMDLKPEQLIAMLLQRGQASHARSLERAAQAVGEGTADANTTDGDMAAALEGDALLCGALAWIIGQQQRRVVPQAVTNGARRIVL